jgi:hypothetical protein
MVEHAAKSAAQPTSSLKAPSMASLSFHPRKEVCSEPSFSGTIAGRDGAAVEVNICRRGTEDDLVHWGSFRLVSRPLLGVTLRGQNRRPAARRRSASTASPYRVSVPPKRSLRAAAKNTAQTSFGPHQESTPWHLGAGPTRLASPV